MALSEGNPTVLVVDDEEMVRSIAAQMLQKLGYTVITAASGQEALDIFEQCRGQIALVVLDMIMPGLGGAEVFDKMRAVDDTVKFLLSSGYSRDSQANEIMGRGCHGFIQKPFRLQELSQTVKALLQP